MSAINGLDACDWHHYAPSASVTLHVYGSLSWEIFFTYHTILTGNDMSIKEI